MKPNPLMMILAGLLLLTATADCPAQAAPPTSVLRGTPLPYRIVGTGQDRCYDDRSEDRAAKAGAGVFRAGCPASRPQGQL